MLKKERWNGNCRVLPPFLFIWHISFILSQTFVTLIINFKKIYTHVNNIRFVFRFTMINTFIIYNLHVVKLHIDFLKLMAKDRNVWLRTKLIRHVKETGWSSFFAQQRLHFFLSKSLSLILFLLICNIFSHECIFCLARMIWDAVLMCTL